MMTRDSRSESFAPRVSSSKGAWHRPPSLLDRIPTWVLVAATTSVFVYSAALFLFGDGTGW